MAQGASVGLVPGNVDFGEVSSGDNIEMAIFVRVSDIDSNFTINPTVSARSEGYLFAEGRSGGSEVSEQEFNDWFSTSSPTIDPNTLADRSNVPMSNPPRVHGSFDLELEIPNEAEPGLRRGTIRINPDLEAGGSGAGTTNIGETRLNFEFYVVGDAERQISVQDIRGFRPSEEEASIEILLTNTGTVTSSTESFEVDVSDERGQHVTTLRASSVSLEPGESEWTNAFWRGDEVDEGSYQIDGEVSYFTGSSYASGSFNLGDIVEIVPEDSPAAPDEDERDGLPVWLVFMILAILTVLMWSFDIEPFWILAIVGGLAVAAFILLSGVSNYLLVVLLMTLGIVVYGVM